MHYDAFVPFGTFLSGLKTSCFDPKSYSRFNNMVTPTGTLVTAQNSAQTFDPEQQALADMLLSAFEDAKKKGVPTEVLKDLVWFAY